MTSHDNSTNETVADRIARLDLTDISDTRRESLTLAHEAGVSDEVFRALGTALRLSRRSTIVLPCHRFERLSRGRGWCRQGRGNAVQWGERTDDGYRVGIGTWTVGGHDGFSRKGQDTWTVRHVAVGDQTWTIAD